MTHCTGSSAAHAVRFLLQAIHSSIGRVCVMLSVNQFASKEEEWAEEERGGRVWRLLAFYREDAMVDLKLVQLARDG